VRLARLRVSGSARGTAVAAGKLDLYYEQGITKPIELIYQDKDGNPIDLTGYDATMEVREYVAAPNIITQLTVLNGGIVLGGATGTVTLNPPPTIPGGKYVYDIKLWAGGVAVERMCEGAFISSPQVTDATYVLAGPCVAPVGPTGSPIIGPTGPAGTCLPPVVQTEIGTTYTLISADAGSWINFTAASPVTVTIPANASVPIDIGKSVTFSQQGTGTVTLVADVGVTLLYVSTLGLRAQYSVGSITKVDTDTWFVVGDFA
jgi:hypothetical protein